MDSSTISHPPIRKTDPVVLLFAMLGVSGGLSARADDEAPATVDSVMAAADRDGNERIEGDEWRAVPEAARSRLSEAQRDGQFSFTTVVRPDDVADALRERMEYVFDYYDRDGDRRLDADEFRRLDGRHASVTSRIDFSRSISRSRFVDYYCRIAVGLTPMVDQARERVTRNLPADYSVLDTDGDGQIGYYEWPRSERNEFFRLDRNEDGFVTPRELAVDDVEQDESEGEPEDES